ncbi:KNS1 Dual specificity protein kinase KNS1 [Candida maltosa Xu316]|uniref:Protein kinase domain-containing protein n=1 Tax=Candida maltosa (strain Xu316) TaxID=1245528 RepID=M3J2M6_CANMX|nr:hypothetical protein G210_3661 [Candida maltosa Xu316]
MISNRKRPRVLSTEGPSSVLNCDTSGTSTTTATANSTAATTTSTGTNNISETPPPYHHSQQPHLLFSNNITNHILSDTSTDSASSSSFPFYKTLPIKSKIDSSTFTNPFLSIHDAASSSSSSYALEDEEDEEDDDDDDVIAEIDRFRDDEDDDDDVIFLEQREIVKRNSDTILYDNDALEAYNLFNVNNIIANPHTTKKQRTNSLPQLPEVKCFYNKIPENYVLSTKKIGNIKTNVISYRTDGESCDDEQGHYIVRVKNLFANRFIIQRSLGRGTFGVVVEAYDKVKNRSVAIKIIRNIQKYRDAAKIELRILTTLKKFDGENLNHCLPLLEVFEYRGHYCFVTTLLKSSLFDYLENNRYLGFPASNVQSFAKQLLRSVAFLYDLKIIHTDLKPENILLHDDSFTKKKLTSSTTIEAFSHINNSTRKTPKTTKVLNSTEIQLIDFGSAIFADEYHSSIVSTRHYRAPEIVLGCGWSFPIDMWSVGCVIIELLSGEVLYKTHANHQHLAMIEKVSGTKIPIFMVPKDGEVAEYFDADGNLVSLDNPKLQADVDVLDRIDRWLGTRLGLVLNLEYGLKENYEKNQQMDYAEFTFWFFMVDLISKMLVVDPPKRITAEEALNHPWFNLGILDEGTSSV